MTRSAAFPPLADTYPGRAPRAGSWFTEQSDNHHTDPWPPAGSSGVRVGSDRIATLRTVSTRTTSSPQPGDVSEAESRFVL